ncbi:xylulokinase [Staphylococcus xylosus]|uniref:xylulokinase n=1 Tax=Staphylococcus xylosus TaxID=1288 RepID=UPI000D1FD060|nr:xylulokinase [Staphylococcus xylosus]PTI04953.1 xylulokinase [Staphylococcus xylosus]
MENAVLGIDIGTSSVKVIAVNNKGEVLETMSEPLHLIQPQPGYNEQHPDRWFEATKSCIKQLLKRDTMQHIHVKGISLSGQMHSLVILDDTYKPIRNAILWNDTRSTAQCATIKNIFGAYVLSNPVLEGFTLTKLLWVKDNEPNHWHKITTFLLPKDYVRFKLTGKINMEYSDASSTLLFDSKEKMWSEIIGAQFDIHNIYPPLVASGEMVGYVENTLAQSLGFQNKVAVFAGGGDNACGALGAGITHPSDTLCSIGTSGTLLTCEDNRNRVYRQNLHYFNHVIEDKAYVMGVTLAAGDSLNWLKKQVCSHLTFEQIMDLANESTIGAHGLIFTPYLSGERTPHGDAYIRGSFVGLSNTHSKSDIARSVIEGITYSLYETLVHLREKGKEITHITSIGGGAKSDFWLQLQADIFNANVSKLKYEEGPCMGAAMIAIAGLGWYENVDAIVEQFISYEHTFHPDKEKHKRYMNYFEIYRDVYDHTRPLTTRLLELSREEK